MAALALARSGCHGVVAVGTVIKGDTDHYDVVVNESAAGLTAASLNTGIPVTNAVLAVHEAAHARERSLPGAGNKGFEAATAAVSMAAAFAGLGPLRTHDRPARILVSTNQRSGGSCLPPGHHR